MIAVVRRLRLEPGATLVNPEMLGKSMAFFLDVKGHMVL